MAKGTAGKNYWALLLMILAGVVLGGFIGQLSAGVPALRPWAPRHIPASTAPESRCAQPPGGPQAGPVFLRQLFQFSGASVADTEAQVKIRQSGVFRLFPACRAEFGGHLV